MKRLLVIFAVCASSLVMGTDVAQGAINSGSKCPKVGKIITVKVKQKKTVLVCMQEGKKRVWRLKPRGNTPDNPGGSVTTTSPVREIASSYAVLADSPYTRINAAVVPSGYLSAMGLASTTGATLFDHPSGLASNRTNLLLLDRGNNRILVWNVAPTSSSTPPDFVLCQSSATSTASGSGLNQCNWPSDAVVTSTGKLLVADTDNNRILVWGSMPTST